ncbi:MAG TPA: alginate lyase family protein [Acidobacteriaceae bacterium]|jgi:hypothetical protein
MPRRKLFSRLFVLLTVCFFALSGTSGAQTFQHPGVLVSRAQLDYIKAMVQAHVEPFYSTFIKAQNSTWGSLSYAPIGPPAGGMIQCGSSSVPDIGCSDSDNDATAAYTQALLWYITGNQAYAQKSIQIMDLYAQNLKGYDTAYSNAPLQAAWDGQKWPRAAEIIRYSNAGWTDPEITAFQAMLNNAIVPRIKNGATENGNWEISMIESLLGIGVFNDDQTLFNTGITYYKQRIPSNFYYHTDGPAPVPTPRGNPGWNGQTVFNSSVDGVSQETCRDFGHTEYSLAGTMNAAETARIQGIDLYTQFQDRLIATLEFHAFYLLGNPVPAAVCGGTVSLNTYPTFEIGYNEYHNRLNQNLPYTLQWLTQNVRQQATPVDYHMVVFETLTHGGDVSSEQPFLIWTSGNVATITADSKNPATFTTNVIPGSNTNPNVTLTVSGAPAGMTATFNPVVVTGAGSSMLTINADSTTAPGVYPLTITGTVGSSTYTNLLTVTVNAPNADYSLAVSPSPVAMISGGAAQFQTTLLPVNSYRGTVPLTASISPAGMGLTASFSPASVSDTKLTSVLTVTSDGTTPAGTYAITVTGSDATHTATANLVVNSIANGCIAQLGNTFVSGPLATQMGTFTAEWDATPSTALNNSNVGLSLGAQGAFTGYAISARFNPTGMIDARNGGAFAANSTINYAAGVTYHFRAVVNVPANTYSIYVTPAGGTEIAVGTNFAFRSEQAGITSIDHWDAISQVGTISLCNLFIDAPDFGLQATPASLTVQAGTSNSYTATVTPRGGFTGTVALTASGLPTGVTATFNPASLSGAATSSTMTIATTAAAVPGVYTVGIQGTSGALTQTTYPQLTITAACGAPIATAASVTVTQSASKAITLSGTPGANCAANDPLTYTVTASPTHGVLTGTAPFLTYTPTQGYTGSDSLSFTVTDALAASPISSAAQIAITVQAANANLPIITSVSPVSLTAGSSATTITVRGSGFLAGSTLLWNGSSRTTTVVNATQVTASIPATDIATPGVADIAVQSSAGISAASQVSIDTAGTGTSPASIGVPATETVTHGSSVSFPVTLTNVQPTFATVACYDLPAGANCSFNNVTSSLTLATSSSTPAGLYTVLVVADVKAVTTVAGFTGSRLTALLSTLIVSLFFAFTVRRRRTLRWLPLLSVFTCVVLALSGCAGGSSGTTTTTTPAAHVSTTMQLTVK